MKKFLNLLITNISIISLILSNQIMFAHAKIKSEVEFDLKNNGLTFKGPINLDLDQYIIYIDDINVTSELEMSVDGGTYNFMNMSSGKHSLAIKQMQNNNLELVAEDEFYVGTGNCIKQFHLSEENDVYRFDAIVNTVDEKAKLKIFSNKKQIEEVALNNLSKDDFIHIDVDKMKIGDSIAFELRVDNILIQRESIDVGNTDTETYQLSISKNTSPRATLFQSAINNGNPVQNNYHLNGWYLSTSKNAKVRLLIDNKIVNTSINYREDDGLYAMFPGYGDKTTVPKPFYDADIDVSTLKEGWHSSTVQVIAANGDVQNEYTVHFEKRTQATLFQSAINNGNPVQNSYHLNGWYLSTSKNAKVRLLIDNKIVNTSINYREDDGLYAMFPGYGDKTTVPKPIYDADIDVSTLKEGWHTSTVQIIDDSKQLVLNEYTVSFCVKHDTAILLESPEFMQESDRYLTIKGWSLSTSKDAEVDVYVDGNRVKFNIEREKRDEVYEIMSNGFGGNVTTPNPGFYDKINIEALTNGVHDVSIKVRSKFTGEILGEWNNKINVKHLSYRKGIDVSEHNGKIDWQKVKNSGINFAMIRIGWGHFEKDKMFDYNVSECERLKIPYGIYHYSYALNMTESNLEIQGVLNALKGHRPQLPVFIDMEDADGYKNNHGMPANTMLQNICLDFVKKVSSKGYESGVYASLNWWDNKLSNNELDSYYKWIAKWPVNSNGNQTGLNTSAYDHPKNSDIWQYTSNGSVSGISGRVDMNYCYYKYN